MDTDEIDSRLTSAATRGMMRERETRRPRSRDIPAQPRGLNGNWFYLCSSAPHLWPKSFPGIFVGDAGLAFIKPLYK